MACSYKKPTKNYFKEETNNMKKIVFSGLGAVGGYYGARMAAHYENSADVEISFIARGANLEAIRKDGIRIIEYDRSKPDVVGRPKMATDNPADIGPVDYIICSTKSYDLAENIRQIKPLIGPETIIVPLLNGVDIREQILEIVPETEVWQGCTYIISRKTDAGVITDLSPRNKVLFGLKNGNVERQTELADMMRAAAIKVYNSPEDIENQIWQKYIVVSTGGTATTYFDEMSYDMIRNHAADYRALVLEVKAVADAKGIVLPPDTVDKTVEWNMGFPAGATTSMHADLTAANRLEYQTLTGYIVREGLKLGIPTPMYQKMYDKLSKL